MKMIVGRVLSSATTAVVAFLLLASLCATGCEPAIPALLAYEFIEDQLKDDEGDYPGSGEGKPAPPVIGGFWMLTAPCKFSLGLASTDVDGHVVDFRQTGGVLPAGYSLVVSGDPDVSGRVDGPPVGPGSWEYFVVAIDNEEKESEVTRGELSCKERD
jgi:hypothetical protein